MADDKNKGPPKLTMLEGGAGKTTMQPLAGVPREEATRLEEMTAFERELKALELWDKAFELLRGVERAAALAAQFTQVEKAQAQEETPGPLYAGTFFDALAAVQSASARILECREATRRRARSLVPTPPRPHGKGRNRPGQG